MKRIEFIALFSLALALMACDDDACFKSKGERVTEYRALPEGLTEVIVYDNLNTHIHIDTVNYVKITAGSNMLSHIKTDIDHHSLILSNGNSCSFLRDFDQDLVVEVHITKDLRNLGYEANGDLVMHDTLERSTFYFFSETGGGKVVLLLNTEFAQVFVVGGFAETYIFGKSLTLRTLNAGSSWMWAQHCPTIRGDFENRSAGDIYVTVSDSMECRLSGVGDIRYFGAPKVKLVSKTGHGQVYPAGP